MESINKCPVCNSQDNICIKILKKYPAIVFPVNKNIVDSVDVKDLKIFYCNNCFHLYQIDIDHKFNEKLYTEYYKFYPYSSIECFVEHYRKPFEMIFSSFNIEKEDKRLLEIGLSSSQQLEYFNNYGFDSYGITPQSTDTNKKIISDFYENHKFDFKFDTIVSRFNLEHIVDLDAFFKKINVDLNNNGLFVVQVPNTEYFIKENILNFYAHEHIHYFTKESIGKLFQRYGFSIEQTHSFNSPSIIIVGRRILKKNIDIDNYIELTKEISENIMNKVSDLKEGKVILYGASLSLTELLYNENLEVLKNGNIVLIDDNVIINKMVMPLYDNEILAYDKDLINSDDIFILVLNSVYHTKIIDKIRKDGLKNKIFAINQSGLEAL